MGSPVRIGSFVAAGLAIDVSDAGPAGIAGTLVSGPAVLVHDDERVARGEPPVTTEYQCVGDEEAHRIPNT